MKIRIHKEGYPVITLVFFILIAIIILINILFPVHNALHYILYLFFIVFYFFVIRFFRYPIREIIPDNNLILSGADGKVVVIEEVFEKEYFKKNMRQVSIFMSPTNVHVNWFPIGGSIKYFRHNHGSYFIASKPKSSDENERTTIVVEVPGKKEVLFRQIAGTVARRIVCYARENKQVTQGDELGIIKFGSRFDLFLPLDAKIEVEIGQKVTGSESIIARF
jgi:phosphatidylserine decarboxylase